MRHIHWVQIEPTKACNLKCTYCARTLVYGDSVDHMDKPLMERIVFELGKLPELRQVLIQGFGEPFLYPHLLDMVSLLKSGMPHLSVQLVTNGMVMNRRVPNLLPMTDVLYVSVDSLKPEYWKTVRIGGSLDRIAENIRAFKDINPRLNVVLNAVVSGRTIEELEPLCMFAARSGCSGIQFIPLYPMEGVDGNLTARQREGLGHEVKLLRLKYGRLDIYAPFDIAQQHRCPWVNNGLYVLMNGKVTPCCVMSSDDDIVYGDLSEQPLEEILSSEARAAFGNDYKKHPTCEECMSVSFSKIWNYENPLPLIRKVD